MTQEEIVRRERLEKMQSLGVDPYPTESHRTHLLKDVLISFEESFEKKTTVICAGRLRFFRKHGGLTFGVLQDVSGSMQIAFHRDEIGEDTYNQLHELVDIGDFFEVKGQVFRTKKGEPTINVSSYRILAKSLTPLPEKFHGLTDIEVRYRQRELDLIMNEEVRNRFFARSNMIATIRQLLHERGFMEVETPILQPIPGGANARPFITHHNALDMDLYLRIAPELYLKRLIVGGFEKIFEIGRCFRNEGIDYSHNPEFTMLELYWSFTTKDVFFNMLEELISKTLKEITDTFQFEESNRISFNTPFPRFTFREAIMNETGIDIDSISSPEEMIKKCREKSIQIDFKDCYGMGEFYDTLWKTTTRSKIIEPTWIFDYPIELKPLAREKNDDPTKSACAQLVVNGAEVVNAYYHELNNPIVQEQRFAEQQMLREKGSEEAQWTDFEFLKALEHGMPPTCGVGIGIDRLISIFTNSPNLKEVIFFPTLRPKTEEQTQI